MNRLVIVSNRLPVTASVKRGRISLARASGGLATGLSRVQGADDSLWIGWSGASEPLGEDLETELRRRLGSRNLVPVPLEPDEVEDFYEGVANEVLWPTFHYLLDRMPLRQRGWEVYERVNDRFAEIVASYHRPDDVVWVQDYHLMRVPTLLRRRVPTAKIGFFLHVPFPPSDLFQTLAGREALLDGLLGADVIGFHTTAYLRHFAAALLRLRGLQVDIDRVHVGERQVRIGVFPMGVDVDRYRQLTTSETFCEDVAQLRATPDCSILLGMDRLDYTKGIPRRLLAFEQLLAEHPELHGRVRLIQVAAPSRAAVGSYRELRNEVDRLVGRIHGEFATPSWVPVHYIYRSLAEREVAALYRAADVMLVTPIRDGMNLVAKEFVATRSDGDGVLVLSELAGASAELCGALLVNPYDIDTAAKTFHRALTMPAEERRERMKALRGRVEGYDLHRWAREFIEAVQVAAGAADFGTLCIDDGATLDAEIDRICRAPRLVVLLDYDGTLVPFASRPELAVPDAELLDLLRKLASCPGVEVHIVSGRKRETLEEWFGSLSVWLHAEHGLASRHPCAQEWRTVGATDVSWRQRVRTILDQFAAQTPGTFVETKTAGMAWHWRAASDPVFAARQADELRLHLSELLMSSSASVLPGDKVIEVRPAGVNKGGVVIGIADRDSDDSAWLVLGDDATDEEMFAMLPEGVVSIHVGSKPTRARFRLPDVSAVRTLLSRVIEQGSRGAAPPPRPRLEALPGSEPVD